MVFDNDMDKVYDSNLSCSNDDEDIGDLYNELYDSLIRTKKYLKSRITKNEVFIDKIKQFEKKTKS